MAKTKLKQKAAELLAAEQAEAVEAMTPEKLVAALRRKRMTTEELTKRFGIGGKLVEGQISKLQESGVLIYLFGEHWGIEKQPANEDNKYPYKSRKDNTFLYGFTSDNHLCSKYERLDVLRELYKRFADEGVDRVFNSGNWIDGEARFNMHDLRVHGMDSQLHYLAENYPEGIDTYAVAGDDHEGWYGQREGIDIGKHAEHIMHAAGRTDWFNLGYMEAFVPLVNANTGATAQLLVMHPGGGSAYAYSYKPQKIIESLQGGEKPAALQIGHYHKGSFNIIRNVFVYQALCTQDQTPFMRKKGIDAHVGGGIVRMEQDPQSGALTACRIEFFQFFNTGFYNNRWSHGGNVTLPNRGVTPSNSMG